MSIAVHPAGPADRPRLAAVLADAFADDPVISHLLPTTVADRAEDRMRRFFEPSLRRSERLGGAWTSQDGDGAAVWFPPSHWRVPLRDTLGDLPEYAHVFGRRLRLAGRLQRRLDRHHPAAPHWYLLYLAVVPDRQGSGVGSSLLRAVLDQCDADGLGAYLEATCEANRRLYLRHGFADVGDPLVVPGNGPVLHPMWRQPQ